MPNTILFVIDWVNSGGPATFRNGLIDELLKNTNTTIQIIYICDNGSSIETAYKNPRLTYFFIHLNTQNSTSLKTVPSRIIKLQSLLSQLKDQKFDFVFTDLIYPTFSFQIARFFCRNFRSTKLFHHIHGSFSEELKSQELQDKKPTPYQAIKFKLFRLLEKTTLSHCQKIFVNSFYSLKLTRQLHGKLPTLVNRPGIDPLFLKSVNKFTKSQAREKLGLNPKRHYVLFTSRIEPRKGVTDFFANIHNFKFSPNITFIVCTHFIESHYLYDFLEKLDNTGLGSRILLINTPSRQQLSLLYKAADLTVMPSTKLETFGFTTLESYYYFTPVVAFDVAANKELISKSHLIRYSGKKSWNKLYEKINQIIKFPQAYPVDYSKYNFSWKGYVKNMNL